MASKTPLDKLTTTIDAILEEYTDEVSRSSKECVNAVAKAGARAVKQAAQQSVDGDKYAKGWTSKVEENRLGAVGVIYNKTPGLPHLLEHGHVSRNGTGRTFGVVPGIEHIAPVERKIIDDFEKQMRIEVSK